jgi:glycosyltransferase involved in cell wall biosynthesis
MRNDVAGLAYANTLFKIRLKKMLIANNYDIIHIVNEEMGYVAKMAKESGSSAKVITSVFSLMRIGKGYNKGLLQNIYSGLVAKGLREAVIYSDMMTYSGKEIQEDAQHLLGNPKEARQIYIGPPHDNFLKKPIPNKRRGRIITVGYVGALAFRKNPIFILKTAEIMKDIDGYRFLIYGSGAEFRSLEKYVMEKELKNVSLMGFAPENRLMAIYDSFDIFLYPSIEEGSSIPVFDALARGLPVILYKKTNMSEEVKRHGILVENERKAAEMLQHISKYGYSPKRRKECLKYVRGFSWDRAIREVFTAYNDLLHE